mgnify:CR=1 FL=1
MAFVPTVVNLNYSRHIGHNRNRGIFDDFQKNRLTEKLNFWKAWEYHF